MRIVGMRQTGFEIFSFGATIWRAGHGRFGPISDLSILRVGLSCKMLAKTRVFDSSG